MYTPGYTPSSSTTNSNITLNLGISYWEQIFTSVIIGLIAIIGIIGNCMIIVAVTFSRKLQTSTNAFVTSLSVADLITSFFMIWFIVGLLGRNGWPIPQAQWICAVTGFMIFTCTGASMYTLGAIGINRLILITKPFLYRKIFTSWKLIILVAIPWLVPGGSIVIFVATGTGGFGYDHTDLTCSDLDTHKKAEIFNNAQTLIGFPIPLIAIIVSYLGIYIYLKRHYRVQKQNLAELPTTASHTQSEVSGQCQRSSSFEITTEDDTLNEIHIYNTGNDLSIENEASVTRMEPASDVVTSERVLRREKISQQQIEITKNLFLVVCAFFICFIPFFIVNPIANNRHVIFYARLPSLANSAINFTIYARKHPDFKVVLGHMMKCSYSDIPRPSKLLKYLLSRKELV